jgi:hypothetical protein
LGGLQGGELDVGLIYESRGLEGVGRTFAPEIAARQPFQFIIYERKKLIGAGLALSHGNRLLGSQNIMA